MPITSRITCARRTTVMAASGRRKKTICRAVREKVSKKTCRSPRAEAAASEGKAAMANGMPKTPTGTAWILVARLKSATEGKELDGSRPPDPHPEGMPAAVHPEAPRRCPSRTRWRQPSPLQPALQRREVHARRWAGTVTTQRPDSEIRFTIRARARARARQHAIDPAQPVVANDASCVIVGTRERERSVQGLLTQETSLWLVDEMPSTRPAGPPRPAVRTPKLARRVVPASTTVVANTRRAKPGPQARIPRPMRPGADGRSEIAGEGGPVASPRSGLLWSAISFPVRACREECSGRANP